MKRLASLPSTLLVVALVGACAPAMASPAGSSLFGGLQAWVDAPLDGAVLKMPVQYSLVCHGTDGSGVQALEFSADGGVLGTATNPDGGATLFNASQGWNPAEPGTYTVMCRAQNAAGDWSGYADARVKVVQDAVTITPTLTPTVTPTVMATITPTITPTTSAVPPAAGVTFTSRVSTNSFEYKRDCIPDPSEVAVTAVLSGAPSVKYVFLFFRLESSALGVTTDWNEGLAMTPAGGDAYRSTVAWDDIPQLSQISGSSATFAYQFVAVGQDNRNLGRSQVFRDVTLHPCQ
jgi:hypothetical protein